MTIYAPGWPGAPPRWTSSAKSGVGTAFNAASRVWFTLGQGVVTEVYFPRVDVACTRDLVLVVTDGHDVFSEERRDTDHVVTHLAQGAPAYRQINTCKRGRYRLEKEIYAHPGRDALMVRIRFTPLVGSPSDHHVFAVLVPHLGNKGTGNTAWIGEDKGVPMLFAQRGQLALALAASTPWRARSAGFVGVSDGMEDLERHRLLTWAYDRAEDGNVALAGELDLEGAGGVATLAIGFGADAIEAAQQARAGIQDVFDDGLAAFVEEWRAWQGSLLRLADGRASGADLFSVSMSVLRTHQDKQLRGAIIASLSIPWGTSPDASVGGYHLVWARDMVEAALALLAAGTRDEALHVIRYLQATQEADGHWPQNMWPSGQPYWNGVQLDETGLPVLLIEKGFREGLLDTGDVGRLWPMVKRAAGYIVRHGPITEQDRWEETAGYSPYTLAVTIAALLAAADLADLAPEPVAAAYLRDTADAWNANLERWTFASQTDLCRTHGVAGYYVRIAPPDGSCDQPWRGDITIRNRAQAEGRFPASDVVSCDALALVRFGLRAPDDPRILDTIKVVDALTRVDTPQGPAWHRYNHDGYGEHADGAPFDGTGIGRAWPLLTGERAHYEIAAGRFDRAEELRRTLEAFAGRGGMIPEQVWDTTDLPARHLFLGRPTGSAMPLVWAHAEQVKLRRSLRSQQVFDLPPQPHLRYVVQKTGSDLEIWRFERRCLAMPAGKTLRVEVRAPARVRFTVDEWQSTREVETRDTTFDLHVADLPTAGTRPGDTLRFTLYWPGTARWEGADFAVALR